MHTRSVSVKIATPVISRRMFFLVAYTPSIILNRIQTRRCQSWKESNSVMQEKVIVEELFIKQSLHRK